MTRVRRGAGAGSGYRVWAGVMLTVLLIAGATSLAFRHVMDVLPIRSVRIVGILEDAHRAALEQVVDSRLEGGFFSVDVEAVRTAVQALPWVKAVSVRRMWPDSLHIAVVERAAVARWGAHQLIEADGTVFSLDRDPPRDLVELEGPPGSALQLLGRYRELQQLLVPLAARVEHLALDARGTWRGRLNGGMVLIFEEGLQESRLRHFAKVASHVLGPQLDQIKQVDLRYANGFAVRWKMQPEQVNG